MIEINVQLSILIPVLLFVFSLIGVENGVPKSEIEIQTDTLELDLDSSIIYWKGTDMGGSHEGIIRFQKGSIVVEDQEITGGKFEVDMNSIEVTDIPVSQPIPRRNLTNHLKSKDFFLVDKYPVSSFEISGAQTLKGDSVRIMGDLSIRDVTKSISITARQFPGKNGGLRFETFFVIDRFEWNVAYQGSFWKKITSIIDNNFVHADIELTLELHFNQTSLFKL